jgi:hypothetical protein
MRSILPKFVQAVSLTVCLFGPILVSAQIPPPPPANDSCAGALIVPSTISPFAPYLSPEIEVTGATTSGDPALPMDCGTNVSRSIWFRFAPGTNALYTLSVGRDTKTTVEDTVMAMYTSPSACNGPFTLFACNDDAGLLRSAISTNLTMNTSYYVVVWVGPVTDVSATPLNVQLRVSRPQSPTNDLCLAAEIISTNAMPYSTAITDTTLATEMGDRVSSCAFGARSVWYRFSPPSTGIYIFSTGSDTGTTVDDTAMSIYRNTAGCNGTFTEVICSDNGFGRALVTTSLTNGQTYYIVVWDQSFASLPPAPSGYIAGETSVQLRVSRATAPTVATLGASSIASTGAVLTASINPNGVQSRYWFEWGTTTSYGNTSAVPLLLAGTSTLTNSIPIGGYPANTAIHYRAVATNSIGRSNGLDQTFLYLGTRPQLAIARVNYRLTFSGSPAHLYIVQMSTNLTSWTDLGAAQEMPSGQYGYTPSGAAALSQRFFRIKLP